MSARPLTVLGVAAGALVVWSLCWTSPPAAAGATAGGAGPKPSPVNADDPQMRAGLAIYTDTCKACHTSSGAGIDPIFPKLAGDAVIQQSDASWLIVMVLQGGRAAATDKAPTGAAMPSLGWRLSNEQVADVVTYVRNSWGNAASKVSAGDVAALR